MDEGTSVNVPYLLAQCLFRYVEGRKQGAKRSGGYFIVRLGVHFGVITKESLWTLTVVAHELTTIDMDKLGPEVVAVHQEDVAPPMPPAGATAPHTIPQRFQRLEEEVYGLRDSIGEQHVTMKRLSSNFRTDDANTSAPSQTEPQADP
ncbi:hypothetical protein Tco_1024187 [Tanacetum coccineum]